ncbi:hypothetical protein GGI13_000729 [Coemansia sp. RSA 455]|nr:hypothetical protein GGI13_000729 [Coemansia sp. RSA 455]
MGFGSILSKATAALEKSQNKGANNTTNDTTTTTTTPAATNSSGVKIDAKQAAGLAKTIFGSKSSSGHGHNSTQAKAVDALADYVSKSGTQQQPLANGQAPPANNAQPANGSSGIKIDAKQAAGLAKTIFGSKSSSGHGHNSTQAKVIGAAADYISKSGTQQQQQPANGQAPPANNAQPANGSSSGKIDVKQAAGFAKSFFGKSH